MKRLISAALIISLALTLSVVFAACGSKDNSEKFVGSWVEVLDNKRVTTIAKEDKVFTWTDPEGKYPAEYKDGKLEVKAGKITAMVTYNSKDDTITAEYDNTKTTYNRKK